MRGFFEIPGRGIDEQRVRGGGSAEVAQLALASGGGIEAKGHEESLTGWRCSEAILTDFLGWLEDTFHQLNERRSYDVNPCGGLLTKGGRVA